MICHLLPFGAFLAGFLLGLAIRSAAPGRGLSGFADPDRLTRGGRNHG